MRAKANTAAEADKGENTRVIVLAGKEIRVPDINLKHPMKEGDSVKLVRQMRGYRN